MKMVQNFRTSLVVCLLGIGALCTMESCRAGQRRSGEAEQRDTLYSKGSYWIVGGRFVENDTLSIYMVPDGTDAGGVIVIFATFFTLSASFLSP